MVSVKLKGSDAAALDKAEDAVHSSGDKGIMMLGVRKDTATPLAASDGDYIPPTFDANGALWVQLAGVLSSALDSIDVAKKSKGSVTTAHNAITATATSAEIDCRGFNSVLLGITISAAQHWTFEVTGCMTSGGTFVSCYELANTGSFAQMITPEINSSQIIVFHGIPDYIKVVATEVDDTATVTVKVQPFNT